MNGIEYIAIILVMILARIAAFISTFPLFRSAMLPQSIKVSLAFALAVLWMSNLALDAGANFPPQIPGGGLGIGLAVIREAVIGALLGFLLGLLFLPAELAGGYLGQEIGFNMAGVSDPTTDTQSNVFGDFISALSMFVFFAADAHQLALGSLFASFRTLPLGKPLPYLPIATVTESFNQVHEWGMELAAPLGAGLFLVTIITAMLMKISPQLNLFSVGIPVRLLLGLLAAFALMPEIVDVMFRIFSQQRVLIKHLGL
ncbi:MAG: flagellar biosynthetic protein FliR [Planctomycetales bacterium]|nr:flagellar biosynthetic protein FliR [Planctomycetales bacterium]MCA9169735.1 flagellar biosynthetic protein FliR [Planctomycetales bacterium]